MEKQFSDLEGETTQLGNEVLVLICENNDKKVMEEKMKKLWWWLVMVRDNERGRERKRREDL